MDGNKGKLIKVVVPYSKWLRGKSGGGSFLLEISTGLKCCLGHAGTAVDIPDKVMAGTACPNEISDYFATKLPKLLAEMGEDYCANSKVGDLLMSLNDSIDMSDSDRAAAITAKGVEAGIEFDFRPDE